MKEESGEEGIWILGTTFRIKQGTDLPEALQERALRARLVELEANRER